MLIAATVLSLALAGGGAAVAQTSTPQQDDSLAPRVLKFVQDAEGNAVPIDPLAPGGYPSGRPQFTDASPSSAAAPDAGGNWAYGKLCQDGEQCLVGDFNGDGRDDVAVAVRDTQAEPQRGDIKVALSDGYRFGSAIKWLDNMCTGGQICRVGDVDGNGSDDIVAFNRGAPDTPGAGFVYVALSQGVSFAPPALWATGFCLNDEVCEVANVDNVPGADIVTFLQGPNGDGTNGDIYVASSNRVNAFNTYSYRWHDYFCIDGEECHLADVTGDGRADAILFVKTGGGKGRVSVAPSDGVSFGASQTWENYFCVDAEQCETGNFDGRNGDDLLTFLRGGYDPGTAGNVYVDLSGNTGLMGSTLWHDNFCLPGQDCGVGDFNGDGRDDVVSFVKTSTDPSKVGQAYVAISSGNPTGFIQPVINGGKWHESFCPTSGSSTAPGLTTCLTGDFDGDGKDDVLYLPRNGAGQAFVALSDGTTFRNLETWNHDPICSGYYDVCRVGDVDKDGADDIIVFSRQANGRVYVYRSLSKQGTNGFAPKADWTPGLAFCASPAWCDVGDYNGDGYMDIAEFNRTTSGNVNVAISNGAGFFTANNPWHYFFCIQSEWCLSADVNADGYDDVLAFTRGNVNNPAKVYVALSNGYQFGNRQPETTAWQQFFCAANEICGVGDFNGDGAADIITFLRSDYATTNPTAVGNVYVGLSQASVHGQSPSKQFVAVKWNQDFCLGSDTCATGDFNGDGKKDIVDFQRTTGDVFVALAAIGIPPYFFMDVTPPPIVQKMLLNLFIRRQ